MGRTAGTARARRGPAAPVRGGRQGPLGWIFELDAGALCLDFVNTLDHRPHPVPRELLNTYADLVSWGVQARAVERRDGERLVSLAARRPAAAAAVLRKARETREALFEIFAAAASGRRPSQQALARLNEALARASPHLRVAVDGDGFAWTWSDDDSLERVVWPVIRSAATLITSSELTRVRVCASETCDWLFLDRTKNATRRWCDMTVCGNRAKVRRYYQRRRSRALGDSPGL